MPRVIHYERVPDGRMGGTRVGCKPQLLISQTNRVKQNFRGFTIFDANSGLSNFSGIRSGTTSDIMFQAENTNRRRDLESNLIAEP